MKGAPSSKTIVAADDLSDEEKDETSDASIDTASLGAKHEESDTRTIIHYIQSTAVSCVVLVRDADILLLLVSYFHMMSCQQLWMHSIPLKS